MKPIIIDMFCGAGGESSGIHSAMNKLGMKAEFHAINHWERAIETHKANFPEATHYQEDIFKINPETVAEKGKRIELLWASPECTHFSCARGGKPCDNQSRSSANQIIKWCESLDIRHVIVENVKEFATWGPLYKRGLQKNRPIQKQKGKYFRKWLADLQALGYIVDYRILNCADYGDATTRRRLFIQAVKGGKRILWPEATHFEGKSWRAAKEIIDFKIPGKSIFSMKTPLKPNTLKRIEAGIKKYWGEYAEPFLIILRGQSKTRSINQPIPTLSAGGGHLYLIEPFILGQQSCAAPRNVSKPIPTISTSGAISLIQPFITAYHTGRGDNRNHNLKEPLPTVDCNNRYGLPRDIKQPLDTVTCKDRFALIDGCPVTLDIRFRMLQPHELAAGQGFSKDYIFTGNKTEVIRQIGNAVPHYVSEALAMTALNEGVN